MTLILRTRIRLAMAAASVPAVKAVQSPTVRPPTILRRLRLTSNDTAASRAAQVAPIKEEIDRRLKLIANAERQIDEATVKIDECYKAIEELFATAKLTSHSNGVHLAEIIEQWSNQTKHIDVQKFRAKVPNEVFWKSIDVIQSRAKEYLTQKELDEIADIKPSRLIGRSLKIKRLPIKTRTR